MPFTPRVLHFSAFYKVVSLTPPDPSLTPANLLHITHHIPLWRSEYSYRYLDMPENQHDEIVRRVDVEDVKQQLFTTWLASHPCPSWEQVRDLLRGSGSYRGVGGEERKEAARQVVKTYLKSELNIECACDSKMHFTQFHLIKYVPHFMLHKMY